MIKLAIINSKDKKLNKQIELENGEYIIGRSSKSDIVLSSINVSKNHAKLIVTKNSIYIEDLSSANGLSVNKEKIETKNLLANDIVKIDSFLIKVLKAKNENVLGNNISKIPRLNFKQDKRKIEIKKKNKAVNLDFLPNKLYPIADKISSGINLRILLISFFLFWSLILGIFVAIPMINLANKKINTNSIELGKLYARQIVRLNQTAILENDYGSLITEIDSYPGQTKGLVDAIIINPSDKSIIAPRSRLGEKTKNKYAIFALEKSKPAVFFSEKKGYISYPLKISKNGTNTTKALVFVSMDQKNQHLTLVKSLDQIMNSLFFVFLAGIIFIIFSYRWIFGPVNKMVSQIEKTLAGESTEISHNFNCKEYTSLKEQVNFLISKAFNNSLTSINKLVQSIEETTNPGMLLNKKGELIHANNLAQQLFEINLKSHKNKSISEFIRDMSIEEKINQAISKAKNGIKHIEKNMILGQNSYILNISILDSIYVIVLEKQMEEAV